MLVRAPIRIGATSPRIVTWNQTLACEPISTSPTTTAPGAMKASSAIRGQTPLNGQDDRSQFAVVVRRERET